MRVIVVGAEGLLGAELLARLSASKEVSTVVSLVERRTAGRRPGIDTGVVEEIVDLTADLAEQFRFADAVVYAGWPICGFEDSQAGRRYPDVLRRTTEGIVAAGVPAAVFLSSAWADAGAEDRTDATTQTPLQTTSLVAARQMAEGERVLDEFERAQSIIRVVRLKCPWVVGAPRPLGHRASNLRRRFVHALLGGTRARFVPHLRQWSIQALQVEDLGEAVALALTGSVIGHVEVTAAPITTGLMAQVFDARPVPMPLGWLTKLLAGLRRPAMQSAAAVRLDLSLHTPPVDATAAAEALGWYPKHPAGSILEGWVRSVLAEDRPVAPAGAPATVAQPSTPQPSTVASEVPSDETPQPSTRRSYEEALEYFGGLVQAITDDQWSMPTDHHGWTVWQLVAEAARSQYRLARCLGGEDPAEVDAHLPGDPLGFERASGWEVAAEKGRLALDRPSPTPADTAKGLLTDATCELAVFGWYLGRAIGDETEAGPELRSLVEAELGRLSSPLEARR